MTDTANNHPIFDEVALDFEELMGYRMFTLVVEKGDGFNVIPLGLPEFKDFGSSFPNEWLLYHPENGYEAGKIHAWTGQDAATDLQRMSCKHAVPFVYICNECENEDDETEREQAAVIEAITPPQGQVVDTIFGPRRELSFNELSREMMLEFLELARGELKDKHNYHEHELTPEVVTEEAVRLYDSSLIKVYGEVEEQPTMVDLTAVITEGVEAGLIEVVVEEAPTEVLQLEADEALDKEAYDVLVPPEPDVEGVAEFTSPDDPEQTKINTFWKNLDK